MASIAIRNLDEATKHKLRVRAAKLNRSMEEEARNILCSALAEEPPETPLAERIQARFQRLGGTELPVVEREGIHQPPDFKIR